MTIKISDETGTELLKNLPLIIKEYNKYISCICLTGDTKETTELVKIIQTIHKAGIKTCFSANVDTVESINNKILSELDYVYLKNKYYIKDYSPFGDIDVWIDL